jgi:hypothetical protein
MNMRMYNIRGLLGFIPATPRKVAMAIKYAPPANSSEATLKLCKMN